MISTKIGKLQLFQEKATQQIHHVIFVLTCPLFFFAFDCTVCIVVQKELNSPISILQSALCTFISKYAKSVIGDMPNNFQLKEKDISLYLLKAVFFPIRIVVSDWVKPTRPNVNYAKD